MSSKYDSLLKQPFFYKSLNKKMAFLNRIKDSRVPDRGVRIKPVTDLFEEMQKKNDYTFYGNIDKICSLLSDNNMFSLQIEMWMGYCKEVRSLEKQCFKTRYSKLYKKLPKADAYVLGIHWYLQGKVDWQQNYVIPFEKTTYKNRILYVGLIKKGVEVDAIFWGNLARRFGCYNYRR
ncbi:hypothetical protein KHQ81_12960 [Mycoplasmatota bacterium]|nr:hypothetical protein KHQ81_12960 [Mycoplasmatota bacterium]